MGRLYSRKHVVVLTVEISLWKIVTSVISEASFVANAYGLTGCGKMDLGRYFCGCREIVSKEECVVKTRSRVGCSAM